MATVLKMEVYFTSFPLNLFTSPAEIGRVATTCRPKAGERRMDMAEDAAGYF